MATPRIAVCGAGRWGKNHVRTFAELGALAAVVDPFEGARATVETLAPDTPFHTSQDAILDDPAIDGIVFATPAAQHCADTVRALEAGKHVFVEKPMALSVDDAETMQQAANATNKLLMVGHLLLYSTPMQRIKEVIQAGTIGDVQHVECRRCSFGTVRNTEDVFFSFSPHDLAIVAYLLDDPKLVDRQIIKHNKIQSDIADIVHAHYTFDTNQTAHVQASWLWPDKTRGTTVIGTKGSIDYNEIEQSVAVYSQHVGEDLSLIKNGHETQSFAGSQPLTAECQHFLDCIANNSRPISHGEHGVGVIRMLA